MASSVSSSSLSMDSEGSTNGTIVVMARLVHKYKKRCHVLKKKLTQKETDILELGKRKLYEQVVGFNHAIASSNFKMEDDGVEEILGLPEKIFPSCFSRTSKTFSTATQEIQTDPVPSDELTKLQEDLLKAKKEMAYKDSIIEQYKKQLLIMKNRIESLETMQSPKDVSIKKFSSPLKSVSTGLASNLISPDLLSSAQVVGNQGFLSQAVKSVVKVREGIYKGDVIGGKIAWGKGVLQYHSGDRYEGDFKAGLPEGYGLLFQRTGVKIFGQFVKGKVHGFAKVKYPSIPCFNNVIANDTSDDDAEENGLLPVEFEGFFIEGKKSGNGRILFKNKDIYEGQFNEDVIEGRGRWVSHTGEVYDGEFKAGVKHGKGFIIPKDLSSVILSTFIRGKRSGVSEEYIHNSTMGFLNDKKFFTMRLGEGDSPDNKKEKS